MKSNDTIKNILIWVVILGVVILLFSNLTDNKDDQSQKMDYSTFVQSANAGAVKSVNIDGRMITGVTNDGAKFVTYMPWIDPF